MTIDVTNTIGRTALDDGITEIGEWELGVYVLGDGQIDITNNQRIILTNSTSSES